MTHDRHIPPVAAWLGYGGLIPFFAGALACWLGGDAGETALVTLRAYGAAILAFLGGVPWGFAARDGAVAAGERLIVGVVPALIAWLTLLVPAAAGLWVLLAAFIALYAWDHGRNLAAAPAWFARLRAHLTVGVTAALVLALAA
jgi:hypothetical protein